MKAQLCEGHWKEGRKFALKMIRVALMILLSLKRNWFGTSVPSFRGVQKIPSRQIEVTKPLQSYP